MMAPRLLFMLSMRPPRGLRTCARAAAHHCRALFCAGYEGAGTFSACHSGSQNTTAGQSIFHSPPMRKEGIEHRNGGGWVVSGFSRPTCGWEHFPEVPDVLEMQGRLLYSLNFILFAVNTE